MTTSYQLPGGPLFVDSGTTGLAIMVPGWGMLVTAAGGTSYAVSLTEATTATDAIDAGLVLPVALTEAATATDSIDAGILYSVSLTDAASAADTTDAILVYGGVLTEPATATDVISGVFSLNASLVDAAAATDTITVGATYSVSLTDAAVALDTIDAELFQPQFLQMTAIAGALTVTLRGIKRTRVVEDVRVYVTRANQAARSASPVATLTAQPDGAFQVVIPLTVSAGYLCTVQCVTTPAVASAIVTAP